MDKKTTSLLLAALCYFLTLDISDAQPRSLGAVFSYAGCSLAYEHEVRNDAVMEFVLRTELTDAFSARDDIPGVSASFTYSIILKEWKSADGNPIRLSAGPGGYFGWTNDFRQGRGVSFGLKGKIGVDCCFARDVAVSLGIAPVLGLHMIVLEESISMKYFRNGLLYTLMPEIGIRYRF